MEELSGECQCCYFEASVPGDLWSLFSESLVSPMDLFISLCKSVLLVHHEVKEGYTTKDTPKGIVFACPEIRFVSV